MYYLEGLLRSGQLFWAAWCNETCMILMEGNLSSSLSPVTYQQYDTGQLTYSGTLPKLKVTLIICPPIFQLHTVLQ